MGGVDENVDELLPRNTAALAKVRREDGEVTPSASQSISQRPAPKDSFNKKGRRPPRGSFNHRIRSRSRAIHALVLGIAFGENDPGWAIVVNRESNGNDIVPTAGLPPRLGEPARCELRNDSVPRKSVRIFEVSAVNSR